LNFKATDLFLMGCTHFMRNGPLDAAVSFSVGSGMTINQEGNEASAPAEPPAH
jgi:hypothetical protein